MILPIVGLLFGVGIGLASSLTFPPQYSAYVAIAILACVDSVMGGIYANIMKKFHLGIFLSGFIGNAVIAMALTWLGTLLNIQLSLAAVLVYGSRLFENFARIRRFVLNKTEKKDNI